MFDLKDLFGGNTGCKHISPKEVKTRLETEHGLVLLDVRSPREYEKVHIPGSINLPLDQVGVRAASILLDKNTTIFVYCLSGGRSSSACGLLIKMGYENVYNLGGIGSWPYDTEKSS